MSERVSGIGVSPGLAVGRACLLRAEALPIVPAPVPPERVEEEVAVFERAVDLARTELEDLQERVEHLLGRTYAGIFGAQRLILEDQALAGGTVRRIRVGRVGAGWALKEVVAEFTRKLDAVEDSVLRERVGDLADVHRRLQRILRGEAGSVAELPEGPKIVVAHHLVPSDSVTLVGKDVIGLATDVGGRTSHTAILAQALGVPAVAGLREITQRVRTGDRLILDGETGEVRLLPSADEAERADERRRARLAHEEQALLEGEPQETRTSDGVEVRLRANIEFPAEVDAALRFGARGIGLYRSEFLFLTHSPRMPTEEEHFETYLEIARRVAPYPAVVRTLDLGGEKYFHDVLDRSESNPVLGLRGVRVCLERPEIFKPQLRGLLRAATSGNLRVMLPVVTTVDEVRAVRRLLAEQAAELTSEGKAVRSDLPLGIMVEVPAAAAAADLLAREVDFFSIGTNDLLQYALAVDRGNEAVNYLYQPCHPGVLRLLRFIIESAKASQIPVALCGEMAADPDLVRVLVGLGLRELSVQPRALVTVREAVAAVDSREAALEVEELLGGTGGIEPALRGVGPASARAPERGTDGPGR